MALKNELESQGNWLFIRRSFLPIIMFICIMLSMIDFHFLKNDPNLDSLWISICLGISMIGLLIRAIVVGFTPKNTSGRNTGAGQVADTVNTLGIYSIVRHPLYVGNLIMWIGIALYPLQLWVIVLCILGYWIYYERIMFAEEQFLIKKFGDRYLNWSKKTPAFIPKLSQWKSAETQFSLKNVIKREYLGFFAPIICLTILSALGYYKINHKWGLNDLMLIYFLSGLAILLVIRFIVKFTKTLDVDGR